MRNDNEGSTSAALLNGGPRSQPVGAVRGPVLLVDRPGPYRRAIEIVLEDAGIQVVCAACPTAEAPAPVQAALVNGTWTGGLSFPESYSRVRCLSECVPTVVLLTHSWARLLESEHLGNAVILKRPFGPDELLAALARALDLRAFTEAPLGCVACAS